MAKLKLNLCDSQLMFCLCHSGVSNAWLETLLSVIEVLPKDTLRHEVKLLYINFNI